MTPQPVQQRPVYYTHMRLMLIVAAILFVIAALAAGGIFTTPMWAWAFGGFAAWVLAGVVP